LKGTFVKIKDTCLLAKMHFKKARQGSRTVRMQRANAGLMKVQTIGSYNYEAKGDCIYREVGWGATK
jgi:hypothetical protein